MLFDNLESHSSISYFTGCYKLPSGETAAPNKQMFWVFHQGIMALIHTSRLLGKEQVHHRLDPLMSICWAGWLPAQELVKYLPCGRVFNFGSFTWIVWIWIKVYIIQIWGHLLSCDFFSFFIQMVVFFLMHAFFPILKHDQAKIFNLVSLKILLIS